jgi:hypothetical protein
MTLGTRPPSPPRGQRAAAPIHVTRHYLPDLTRQVKALLRLLENYTEERLTAESNGDIHQTG